MNQITHPPVINAMQQLKALSIDKETRRLAEIRERALMNERTELAAAEERGDLLPRFILICALSLFFMRILARLQRTNYNAWHGKS